MRKSHRGQHDEASSPPEVLRLELALLIEKYADSPRIVADLRALRRGFEERHPVDCPADGRLAS